MNQKHPTFPVTITGKVCKIDKEIAGLVENLNEFTINDKKPFETINSCQEQEIGKDIIGGKTWVMMKPFDDFCEDTITMSNILLDATQRRTGSRKRCDVNLKLEFGKPAIIRGEVVQPEYIPTLEVDCSLPSTVPGTTKEELRQKFEKDRKDTILDIVLSIRSFER